MDKTLGEKIKELREINDLTQGQLSIKTGKSRSLISLWEQGKRNPNYDDISVMAKAFGVSSDYLLGITSVPNGEVTTNIPIMKKSVTVYGKIPAGVPFEAIEDICDNVEIPSWLEKKKDLFGLVIVGDSMSKIMPDGAIAILQKCDSLNNGEIGAIMVNGYDATIKRFYKLKSSIVLEPDSYNPEHKPIIIKEGSESVRIIGKVLWFCASDFIK